MYAVVERQLVEPCKKCDAQGSEEEDVLLIDSYVWYTIGLTKMFSRLIVLKITFIILSARKNIGSNNK